MFKQHVNSYFWLSFVRLRIKKGVNNDFLEARQSVSTFPSSLRVTSAAPQTAGRRSRLQQPYSSAPPLKSGPPETGKKKQEADVTCNDKNDKTEMANLSLTEAMTFKRAGAIWCVKMVFFKVLSKLFISRHWSVEAKKKRVRKNLLHQRHQLSPPVFRLSSLCAINQYWDKIAKVLLTAAPLSGQILAAWFLMKFDWGMCSKIKNLLCQTEILLSGLWEYNTVCAFLII